MIGDDFMYGGIPFVVCRERMILIRMYTPRVMLAISSNMPDFVVSELRLNSTRQVRADDLICFRIVSGFVLMLMNFRLVS